jgi:hypothetical protein
VYDKLQMSYHEVIKTGGFNKESSDVFIWGGNPENEFVPNERINSFIQARLLRAARYEKMSVSTEQYGKFIRELYSGFGDFNPYNDITYGDIAEYLIENSGIKDIIWAHLFELFNCIAELNEVVCTQAVLHCDHLSTSGLNLNGDKLDIIIRNPHKLQQIINDIIDFINSTNAKNVKSETYEYIKPFEHKEPDYEARIRKPQLSTIAEMRIWVKTLLNSEVKMCKYLRKLENYHNYVINESDKLFEKCNELRTVLKGGK